MDAWPNSWYQHARSECSWSWIGRIQCREAVPVSTGRFELTAIDGQPLPLRDGDASLVAGTFSLDSNGTFTESREWRRSDQEDVFHAETYGTFSPSAPAGLSFYVESSLWAYGKIEGDTLRLTVLELDDFGGRIVATNVYVKANLP